MSLLLNQDAVTRDPSLVGQGLRCMAADAGFLRSSYPHFDDWFMSKVLPGIYTGERTLIIEERSSAVVGLLILKHTATEKKLCTLRVRPEFESRGLGIRLFETAFERLGTERPLLSVSESTLPKFARIFEHFGFAKAAAYRGLYLPRIHEFSYNGLLDAKAGRLSRRPAHSRVAQSQVKSPAVGLYY